MIPALSARACQMFASDKYNATSSPGTPLTPMEKVRKFQISMDNGGIRGFSTRDAPRNCRQNDPKTTRIRRNLVDLACL